MAMAASDIGRNGVLANVSMDISPEGHSQTINSFGVDTPALTTDTSTQASSTASLHDDIIGETDYDLVESIEIDENSIPSVIEEICPVDGPCVQCVIEQPCSFRFTDNGETLYVCNEPCIKAYQAEHPGKYKVTRKKYLIEEITPKTLLCSECEQKKTCYFYHNFHGEDTYYCSLNCLEGMMADEKDMYAFKHNSVTVCIDQIRPKEGQCLICEEVKPCEFSLVRYGEPRFLCERSCIKILSRRERARYYIKKLRVSKPDVSNAIDRNLDEGYKIQAKAAAMVQREQSFHRRCSQCTLILMIDEDVLTWEAMDFCDEICLERFQSGIGSRCAKCNTLVQHPSLGKYCVRLGYDIRQFCNSRCLEEFKKGLKICCYCRRDISASTQVFLARVGDKGQYGKFCAPSCVDKFEQMSKNPEPQPVWAKCAVCSLEKDTMIEIKVTETASKQICSGPCFAAYKFVNNILPDQCKWCKKYFERKPTNSFTTYDDSNPNCFCSLSCMTIHLHHTRALVSCNWCKSQKYNFDMIRKVDNDQAVMMCSLYCLSLYQVSSNCLCSSNGVHSSTLARPAPVSSIEQGRTDVTTLAAEQLITLTKTRKRRKTTQSSKQDEHQIKKSPRKLSLVIPDSPPSGRKKGARNSRNAGSSSAQPPATSPSPATSLPPSVSQSQPKKASPTRVPCPLVPGVPVTPPARKVQAWEKKRLPETCCELKQAASGSSIHIDFEVADASSIDPLRVDRSTPSPQFGGNIFEDDECLGLPDNVDSASDIDVSQEPEEVGDAGCTDYMRHISDVTEDLPSNLVRLLEEMDTRDDSALREVASDQDMLNFNWTNDPNTFIGLQETFAGEAGPTFSVDGMSPLDVFQKIWDNEILDLMVRETNRYGRQLYSTANKLWSDVNTADIWIFLALIMLQSILILPVEREYWYPCMEFLKVGNFQKIMPMNKFLRIKKCLHFVNNDTLRTKATGEDPKAQKIRPIVTHLNDKFSSLYLPEQHIAIDESLLLWKGRLAFVQSIETKAARVGIKSYELCESRTGYLWRFLIYTGKGDKSQPSDESVNHDERDLQFQEASSKIVYNLVRPLLNKGHTLVMDNFYNSPLLSRKLKSKKTDTMGTLRLQREFVPDTLRNITKSNTRVGEVIYTQTEDITITVWHDTNIVAMISTFHKAVVGGKEKYGTYKYKPQVVLDYNMTMGGVDKKDQMLQAFPLERVRNLVWYKKLFRRLLNVSIYNAFVIYNHNKNGNHRKFRTALVKEILDKIQGQIPDPRTEIRRTGHFPAKSETKRARCRFCSLKKIQSRTAFKCDTCNVNLCLVGCFKEYHLMLCE